MAKEQTATREQVEEEMRQLRKVFSSVRLIPAENVQGRKGRRPCYAHWKRDRPCENCVAQRVLLEKSRKSKLVKGWKRAVKCALYWSEEE